MNSTAVCSSAWSSATRSSTSPRPWRRARSSARRGSAARVRRERHRDHDALLHPAGELVRVARACTEPGSAIWTVAERLARPVAAPRCRSRRGTVNASATCGPIRSRRVQRARRGSGRPSRRVRARSWRSALAAIASDVLAGDRDRPARDAAVARQVADDRERGRRLAAAGLADEPVRLAARRSRTRPAQHRSVACRARGTTTSRSARASSDGGAGSALIRSSTCWSSRRSG